MEKYHVYMKNPKTEKEVCTSGWNIPAIKEWIQFHEKLGYILMESNFTI